MTFNIEKGAESIIKSVKIDNVKTLRWESQTLEETPHTKKIVLYSFYSGNTTPDALPFLRLVGKFYADETGHNTYQTIRVLEKSLAQTTLRPILNIPHVLFYDPNCRLFVQQYVEWIPYYKLLNYHDYPEYFRLFGMALSSFHAQNVPAGEKKTIHDHLKELIHPHPMKFSEKLPKYRTVVEEVIKELNKKETLWQSENIINIAPLHRDIHLRQLFYGEEQVWLIDWDYFAKGDPALDLGNFIVYLKTHISKECMSAIDAFLEGYCSVGDSSILNRVFLYESLTYLRLACKNFRLKKEHWEEKVKDMLSLSVKSLSENFTYARS